MNERKTIGIKQKERRTREKKEMEKRRQKTFKDLSYKTRN